MSVEDNKAIIEKYYTHLGNADTEAFKALHSDDIIYNIIGSIPISGRAHGKTAIFDEIVADVFARLKPESIDFSRKWKIMCADEHRVVALMQGGGVGQNGVPYNQTYCHIFTIEDGLIVETHEFFDSALAEAALYNNPLKTPREDPEAPFDF